MYMLMNGGTVENLFATANWRPGFVHLSVQVTLSGDSGGKGRYTLVTLPRTVAP